MKNIDIDHARYFALAGSNGWYGNLIMCLMTHGFWHIFFMVNAGISYAVSYFWARAAEKMRKND